MRAIGSQIVRGWLAKVRQTFPDVHNLHSRIDLLLGPGKPCVALIPWKMSRESLKPALEILLDSSHRPWFRTLNKRSLFKDTLVTHGPHCSGPITHKSTVVYTIPSPRLLDKDIIELCPENADLARQTSHVHVYVRAHKDEDWPSSSDYPELHVTLSSNDVLENDGGLVSTLQSTCEFPLLETVLARKLGRSRDLLYESVCTSARQVVDHELGRVAARNTAHTLISQWTQQAHVDLQQNLETSLQQWQTNSVPWYYVVLWFDHVQESAAELINTSFLVQSQRSFVYLCGQLASRTGSAHVEPQIPEPFAPYKQQLVSVDAAKLHKNATGAALVALGGIFPCTAIPAAAVYFAESSGFWMGAIAALGVTLCVSRAHKSWIASTTIFAGQVLQCARECIAASECVLRKPCTSDISNLDQIQDLVREMPTLQEPANHA